MKENLNIHFIWCGSRISRPICEAVIEKAIALKAYFINYNLIYHIWTDQKEPLGLIENIRAKIYSQNVF